MPDFDSLDVYTVEAADCSVTLGIHGDDVVLLTSHESQGIIYLDELFSRTSPGAVAKLTRAHALRLRDLLTETLDPDKGGYQCGISTPPADSA